jgi:hypothetical protein
MKLLATVVFIFTLLLILILYADNTRERQETRSQSAAFSFVVYRNAVNRYALTNKLPGEIPPAALDLPIGLAAPDRWSNRIVVEDDEMHCYVWGPATPDDVQAVIDLLLGSRAIGWNDQGNLARPGAGWPLPTFIPYGNVVSVISIH